MIIISIVTYRVPYFGLLSAGYLAYLGHLEGVSGQTPGKAMQGTRLVNENGELLGSGAGIGRKFVHILDAICFIGYLLPLVDTKRQTFADKIMNSYVVTGVEKKPFAVDLWLPPKT
ncbi:MAG TPA: RDD family protein [Acidimicrobiia bacterium]|nr:RDD family protein [Acidimicrobiia bacterium]